VTNFELAWTWNKVAVVENAKKVSTVPRLPLFAVHLFKCTLNRAPRC